MLWLHGEQGRVLLRAQDRRNDQRSQGQMSEKWLQEGEHTFSSVHQYILRVLQRSGLKRAVPFDWSMT